MLYIFDKDGTICRSKSGKRFINSVDDQELIPGVKEKIDELKEAGHSIAIASNQGGVAFEIMSFEKADEIMEHARELIGAAFYTFCPSHPNGTVSIYSINSINRKPNPGMLFQCMFFLACRSSNHVIYVGDRDEDKEAAERAGVGFEWADDFFDRRGEVEADGD